MSLTLMPVSLTDSVSEGLRRRIISGEIAPGTKITEGWVAEAFSVARPTAKAGLDRLSSEGLLRRGPRRSSVVPLLTADDVQDIYLTRETIELRAVSTLAGRSDAPDAARRALRSMQQAAEDHDVMDHIEADVLFHRELVRGVGSERLVRMHETVMGEAQLCIAQVQADRADDLAAIAREHADIFEAIGDGSIGAAKAALKSDLRGSRDRLIATLRDRIEADH